MVRNEGRKATEPSLGVYFLEKNEPPWRVGLTVSGKVVKSAVQRNRLRRVLLATIEEQAKRWGELVKGDMVIVVWRSDPDEAKLKNQLKRCLKKLSLA